MGRDIRLKWNPPSRSRAAVDELWAMLARGEVHTIGSDHAPLSKVQGADIWTQAPGGGNTVETMFEVVASEALETRNLSLIDLVNVFSTTPAKVFGLYPRKGTIAIGSDADFVVTETAGSRRIDASELEYLDSSAAWSPYDGREVSVYPIYTIVRGTVVAERGRVLGSADHGELITGGTLVAV
jgi:dihydroorotase-like cyclic amidohydrolase